MPITFPRRSGNPAHRPEMFESWVPRMPKANGALTAAMEDVVATYKDFYKAHQRASMDETSTPGARLVSSAKMARLKMGPVVERLNKAADEAAAHAGQLAAKIEQVYNPPSKPYEMVGRHREIREHFKALPQTERLKLFEGARKAGDEDTLIALASCQAYLSGLASDLHQLARDTLVEAHAPQEAALLAGITEQRNYAVQLRDTALQSVADAVDFQKADELISAAATELA